MRYLLLTFLLAWQAHAQQTPQIDPNKFTVCAITINSDDEKKIFQAQVNKNKTKFNPVVELTDFGDDNNWFQKACESKIKCDQLVISGHFGGDFFSSNPDQQKRLSLEELEKAACSKSCGGILSDPYEVFLLGCNTLAGKDLDSRTPAQYLQVLLNDGFSTSQAEMVVQSRYGAIGDSNKGSMQRAFAGGKKNIYGFDSVGPSGKTITPFLNNYFSKTPLSFRLEKLQAERLMNAVLSANDTLTESLKGTAFTQCHEASLDNPVTKKICMFQDGRVSNREKIALMTEILGSEDYLTYLPAISKFMEHPMSFSDQEKADLKLISENQIIKSQILALIDKTSSLGLKSTWGRLAMNLQYLSKKDASAILQKEIEKNFQTPMTSQAAQNLCDGEFNDYDIDLKNEKITSLGKFESMALSCLKVRDPKLIKRMIDRYTSVKDQDVDLFILDFLAEVDVESVPLSPKLLGKFKNSFNSKDSDEKKIAFQALLKFYPEEKSYLPYLKQALKSKEASVVHEMLWTIINSKTKNLEILKEVAPLTLSRDKNSNYPAVKLLAASKLRNDVVQKPMLEVLKADSVDFWVKLEALEYFSSIKPVSNETLDTLKAINSDELKPYVSNVIKKLEEP